MALINWDDSFSVNIEIIDKQHRKLIDMLNEFYENFQNKTVKEKIVEVVRKMNDYTRTHFKTEEEFLKQNNYPFIDAHKEEHKEFINKVADLEAKLASGQMVITLEVTNFLRQWWRDHILEEDMKYAVRLGVKEPS